MLLDALNARGVGFECRHLFEGETVSSRLLAQRHVVFLLPVLGDNDLTDTLRARLEQWVSIEAHLERAICVIAHGDRHVSDECVTDDMPFSAKVRSLFRSAGVFALLDTKLDRYTAVALAEEILRLASATSANDIAQLSGLARLLPKAPLWQPHRRLLDFYDPASGYSLLKHQYGATLRQIAARVSALEPRVLKLNHAGLGDDALPDIARSLHAQVIDLSGNAFTLDTGAPVTAQCRWLGMAANGLTRVNLSALPSGIEHLYLQKNGLREFAPAAAHAAGLRTLSLYRNTLETFEWPARQTAIERLNLGANPLAYLPETLADCVALESLGLARTALRRLPEWIFSLPGLRELDISYVEERIPAVQIGKLRHMGVSLITRPGLVLS